MTNPWHLLRINPQSQTRFCAHISTHAPDVPIYYPQYSWISRPRGKRFPITQTRPVYPGYLFIQAHKRLPQSTIPIRIIRFGVFPAKVPDSVIIELRRLESLNLLVREEARINPYVPGATIRVHHPVADITAIVIHLMGDRILVDTALGKMICPIGRVTLAGG